VCGKSLLALGEEEGMRMIRDAIDIQVEAGQQEPFLLDLRSFAEGYLNRSELTNELEKQRILLDEAAERAKRAERLSDRLSQLLSSIKQTQPHWSGVLDDAVLAADDLFSQEQFTEVVSKLCNELRESGGATYSRTLDTVSNRYPHLPHMVLQALATAEFLLLDHQGSDLPIFAPVVLEFAKAAETAVNSVLVEPFLKEILIRDQVKSGTIHVGTRRQQPLCLRIEGRPVKHLSLGELSLLCSSQDQRWGKHIRDHCGPQTDWVMVRLPDILEQVRVKRNGLAHYSSAERSQAKAIQDFVKASRLFESLDRLARTLPNQS
jgi:hypothetical protein